MAIPATAYRVRELFAVIADRFETVYERNPYYSIVRTILHEYGNISITDVKDDMLQGDEMELFRDILGFAGVPVVSEVPEIPVVVPVGVPVEDDVPSKTTEVITVTIAGRTFTCEMSSNGTPDVKIEFKGVKITISGVAPPGDARHNA